MTSAAQAAPTPIEPGSLPVVRHAASFAGAGIDALSGHAARTLLHRLVDDLTAHPDELGNAIAVLRTIERGLPSKAAGTS